MKSTKLRYALFAISAMAYQNISPMEAEVAAAQAEAAEAAEAAAARKKAASDAAAQSTKNMLAKAAREREVAEAEKKAAAFTDPARKVAHQEVFIDYDKTIALKQLPRERAAYTQKLQERINFLLENAEQSLTIYTTAKINERAGFGPEAYNFIDDYKDFLKEKFNIEQKQGESNKDFALRAAEELQKIYNKETGVYMTTTIHTPFNVSLTDFRDSIKNNQVKFIQQKLDDNYALSIKSIKEPNLLIDPKVVYKTPEEHYEAIQKKHSFITKFINWIKTITGTDSASKASAKVLNNEFLRTIKDDTFLSAETAGNKNTEELKVRRALTDAMRNLSADQKLQVINTIGDYLSKEEKAKLAAYLNKYILQTKVTLNSAYQFILKA